MYDYSIQISDSNKRDAKGKTGDPEGYLHVTDWLRISRILQNYDTELFFSQNPYSGSLKSFSICPR